MPSDKPSPISIYFGIVGGTLSVLCGAIAMMAPPSVLAFAILGNPGNMIGAGFLLVEFLAIPFGIVFAIGAFMHRGLSYFPAKLGLAMSIIGVLEVIACFTLLDS